MLHGMAWRLLNRSESSALRAIEAALEAPAPITHDMEGIAWGLGGRNRRLAIPTFQGMQRKRV